MQLLARAANSLLRVLGAIVLIIAFSHNVLMHVVFCALCLCVSTWNVGVNWCELLPPTPPARARPLPRAHEKFLVAELFFGALFVRELSTVPREKLQLWGCHTKPQASSCLCSLGRDETKCA